MEEDNESEPDNNDESEPANDDVEEPEEEEVTTPDDLSMLDRLHKGLPNVGVVEPDEAVIIDDTRDSDDEPMIPTIVSCMHLNFNYIYILIIAVITFVLLILFLIVIIILF